jgi:hypothetical protein
VGEKDFPVQGRYGKGVIAWDLPGTVRIAGVVADKPNHMATIHLSKGAPKSTRLDEAGIRKRAATKGDVVVEVKPGEEVVSVNVGWTVEKFVEMEEEKPARKRTTVASSPNGRKPAPAKASSPRSSQKGKGKPSPKKKPMAKAKTSAKKSASKRASKPVKNKKK